MEVFCDCWLVVSHARPAREVGGLLLLLLLTNLIRSDLDTAYQTRLAQSYSLPDPRINSSSWFEFIKAFPSRLNSIVDSIFFIASVCDREVKMNPPSSVSPVICGRSFSCTSCNVSFKSAKALYFHEQSFHGRRSSMRYYANTDGVCPVCGVRLGTRLRLLKHLSDKRRDKCRSQLTASYIPPLPDDVVQQLDEADRATRAAARAEGFSYVGSKSQALRADGKRAGLCTA